MTSRFHNLLQEKGALLLDGATGTNLIKAGLGPGEPPEPWNIHKPESIRSLYQGWVDSGSDLVLTNTFGGNRYRLALHNLTSQTAELNRAAACLGREVADKAGRSVLIAGSMGPTGEMYQPLGALSMDDAESAYREQADALKEGGVDLLWIETVFSFEELRAASRAARQTGLPVVATMSFDSAGRTMMGITPEQLVREAEALGLDAFGANCGRGASDTTNTILGFFAANPALPVVSKGNCGVPQFTDGDIRYSGTEEIMADYTRLVYDAGARLIGGCCGTTPAHLAAMRKALDDCLARPPQASPDLDAVIAKLGPLSDGAAKFAAGKTGDGSKRTRRRQGQQG